jgi:hypothetical protein
MRNLKIFKQRQEPHEFTASKGHGTIFYLSRESGNCLYFLDFQEINEPPMKMQNPIIDLQVSTLPSQSKFEKAFN